MTIGAMYSDHMKFDRIANPTAIRIIFLPRVIYKISFHTLKGSKDKLIGRGGVSFGEFSLGRSCSTLFGRSCLYPQHFGKIIFNYCHLYNVKSSTKWENIATFWVIALHVYPISMDYKIVFQKLHKTYASRKYGMGKLCPCFYFEKSLKVKQLPSLRFINLNTNLCRA